MYRSILVPLDGSKFAEHALPIARSIVQRTGAMLQLLYVHVPTATWYIEGTAVFDEKLDAQLKENQRRYLEEVIKRLNMSSNVTVTPVVLDVMDTVASTLNEHAKAMRADLIVMTTHGYGTFGRFWLGSVADKFMRQSEKPVLFIRSKEATETEPDLKREPIFQNILIPLDGSALAEQILNYASTLGSLMKANYTLLRVIEPKISLSYPPTEYTIRLNAELQDKLRAEAKSYLDSIAGHLRKQGETQGHVPLKIQTKVIFHPQPAIAILEEADKEGIDLIAMETHGYGGLTRLLIGSVADKVLRGTTIPVLLHRPQLPKNTDIEARDQ
jgi:nucleotide-binding universal stress UspA family protein